MNDKRMSSRPTWQVPAKTFFLGEYAAIAGGPAILLTTMPYFEISLLNNLEHTGIHPDSPAGKWWVRHRIPGKALSWFDPYDGIGGLGASSAQFIGAFMASGYCYQLAPSLALLLDAYYQTSWDGDGLKPSGYDIISQTQRQCVYIHRQANIVETFDWAFQDITFLLVHSGQKLMTHYHLKHQMLPPIIPNLCEIAEQAKQAFMTTDQTLLIRSVNDYQEQLVHAHLMAAHTLAYLEAFRKNLPILAAKGCGAMGADVLLLIIDNKNLKNVMHELIQEGWHVLATQQTLYQGSGLFENNLVKTLEILS